MDNTRPKTGIINLNGDYDKFYFAVNYSNNNKNYLFF